jgi:hypothetical protein
MYQSDITQFLNQLKQQKPTLEAEQRRGRSLLWDKQPIDLEERAEQQASRVQQTSYQYCVRAPVRRAALQAADGSVYPAGRARSLP